MNAAAVGDVLAVRRTRVARWLILLRWARRYPMGATGTLLVCTLVLVAVLGQYMTPYSYTATDAENKWASPSRQHWVGTDHFGRDVFSRILVGARASITVGILSTLLGTSAGAVLGVISGYKGGVFDIAVQRVVDIVMPIPSLILALLLVVVLGVSFGTLVLAIAVAMVPTTTRVLRSVTLSVKEAAYVEAARSIGCSDARIMVRHIAPNTMAPYMILFSGYIGSAIVVEASLAFLGLGIPPPMPTWGQMLRKAMEGLQLNPWAGIAPGVALSLAVFGFNLLGDALRDTFDPRLRQ